MKILTHEDKAYPAFVKKLYRRAIPSDAVSDTVAEIVAEVAKKGDRALVAFAQKFDGARLTAKSLRVTGAELEIARNSVSQETKSAIKSSLKNIHAFAAKSLRKNWKVKNPQGVEVGERFVPFDRVGVYVPGGKAPLVSTSLMTAGFAQAAGVPEIVAATPPGRDGLINPTCCMPSKPQVRLRFIKRGCPRDCRAFARDEIDSAG